MSLLGTRLVLPQLEIKVIKFNVTRQDVPKHLETNGEIILFG